jgi:hypothetical protein
MPPLSSSDDVVATNLKQIARFSGRFAQRDPRATDAIAAALRKLRAVLPALAIEPGQARKLDLRMKRTSSRLKRLRDVDTLIALVDELGDSEKVGRAALAGVKNSVRQSSAAVDAGKLRRKTAADLKRLTTRVAQIAPEIRGLAQPAVSQVLKSEFAARGARHAASLQQALVDAGSVYLVDRLRPLRRSVHKMRDEVAPLANGSPIFGATETRSLDRAADLLDRMRNLRRLIKRVRDIQKTLTPPDLHAWHQLDALIIALESRGRRLHARLLRERPTLVRLCVRLAARPVSTRVRRKAS